MKEGCVLLDITYFRTLISRLKAIYIAIATIILGKRKSYPSHLIHMTKKFNEQFSSVTIHDWDRWEEEKK